MNTTVRTATIFDLDELVSIDTVAEADASRRNSISNWLRQDTVLAAEEEGQVVGYAVLNYAFFGRCHIDMLMVAEANRGRGIGQRLLQGIESMASSTKVFVTTNQSNLRMQKLLLRNGYKICGFIEELDPGDPEVVFFKVRGQKE